MYSFVIYRLICAAKSVHHMLQNDTIRMFAHIGRTKLATTCWADISMLINTE